MLTEVKTPDATKLEEAMQRKMRLEKLMRVCLGEIKESVKGRKAGLERRISLLDSKVTEITNQANEVGAKLAEFSRLTKDHEDSDKAYREMFDLVHKYQVSEEMQGDYVSIMQRAGPPMQVVKPWWSL